MKKARAIASLTDVNRKMAVYYFHHLKRLIYEHDDSVEKLTKAGKIILVENVDVVLEQRVKALSLLH